MKELPKPSFMQKVRYQDTISFFKSLITVSLKVHLSADSTNQCRRGWAWPRIP